MGLFNKKQTPTEPEGLTEDNTVIPVPPPQSIGKSADKSEGWIERGRTAMYGKEKSDAFNVFMIRLQCLNFSEWPDIAELLSAIEEVYLSSGCDENATIKHLQEFEAEDGRKIIVSAEAVQEYNDIMETDVNETTETGVVETPKAKTPFWTPKRKTIAKLVGCTLGGAALGVGGTLAVAKYKSYKNAQAAKAAEAAAAQAKVAIPAPKTPHPVNDVRRPVARPVAKKPMPKPVHKPAPKPVAKPVVKPAAVAK